MSEYLLKDVPWDDENIVDREPEGGDGKHHFGFLRLYPLAVTKVFEAGNYLTIPGVTGGNYDGKDENGLKKFKGWKPGGSQYLFILVATKQDKDGNDYQVVKQYPSKVKKNDPHLWGDFVLPALKQLSSTVRGKITSEGVYCEWDEIATGHKIEIDNIEHEIKAWGNFKPHSDEASLNKASDGFFAQFNNGASTDSIYPALWIDESSVDDRLGKAKLLVSDDWDHLARQMELVDENGKIAQTPSGKDVNIPLIISKNLGISEDTIRKQMQPQQTKTPF